MERWFAAPIAGFYTYGEITRTSGMNFRNQTLVVLSIA